MDAKAFSTSSPGALLPLSWDRPDAKWAFVPNPLPPAWEFPRRLVKLLIDARTCLASLDGTGKHLPNPEILLTPLQGREAQLSSQLEGTYTDPKQESSNSTMAGKELIYNLLGGVDRIRTGVTIFSGDCA